MDCYRLPFYQGATELSAYGVSEADQAYRDFRSTYGGIVGLPTDLDPSRMSEALETLRGQLG